MTTRLKPHEYKNPNSMRGRARKFDPKFYKIKPDQERLRFLFDYRRDGEFIRKNLASPMSNGKVGEVVKGSVCTDGYKQIFVDGRYYLLHQLVWVWHHGFWAENQIDHINRIRDDNRLCNLREVSPSCNARNSFLSKRNSSGVKGVSYHKSRRYWAANIRFNGRLKQLYQGQDFTEAAAHRYAAEQCLNWGDCDRESSARDYLIKEGIICPA